MDSSDSIRQLGRCSIDPLQTKVYVIYQMIGEYADLVAYVFTEDEAKAAVAHLGPGYEYDEVARGGQLYKSVEMRKSLHRPASVTKQVKNTLFKEKISYNSVWKTVYAADEQRATELLNLPDYIKFTGFLDRGRFTCSSCYSLGPVEEKVWNNGSYFVAEATSQERCKELLVEFANKKELGR